MSELLRESVEMFPAAFASLRAVWVFTAELSEVSQEATEFLRALAVSTAPVLE
jgi:hypothetical protein